MRIDSASREVELNVSAPLDLCLLLLYIPDWQPRVRLCAKQQHLHRGSRNSWYRGIRCRKWRLRYRPDRIPGKVKASAARNMQQLLRYGPYPSTRHWWSIYAVRYLAVVFLG